MAHLPIDEAPGIAVVDLGEALAGDPEARQRCGRVQSIEWLECGDGALP